MNSVIRMMASRSSFSRKGKIAPKKIFKPEVLDEVKRVYAHSSKNKEPEKLLEHFDLTHKFFLNIVENLSLDKIVKGLLNEMYCNLELKSVGKKWFRDFFKSWIENIIYYHDLGKFNRRFQEEKFGKQLNKSPNFYHLPDFKEPRHSKYSMGFLSWVLVKELKKIKSCKKENWEDLYNLFYLGWILTTAVDRHHSYLKDLDSLKSDFEELQKQENFREYLQMDEQDDNFTPRALLKGIQAYLKGSQEKIFENRTLFYLYKLVYSLLISSDYYATLKYKKDVEIEIGHIDAENRKEIVGGFYTNKEYNRKLRDDEFVESLWDTAPSKIQDLNRLRSRILIEASASLKKALGGGDRVFFLNVPTSGGKTNISMKLLVDILEHPDLKVKRGYYVFPYVNLIEQNYEAIVKTLTGRENQDIISPVYHCNEWDFSLEDEEELKYYVNQQFLNYPLIVMSNANFFNTFIKNRKGVNYKIYGLANSVVILDEVQTLPNSRWEYFAKVIWDIAEKYNVYFIIMSATIPDLSEFVRGRKVRNLIENPKKYSCHSLFRRSSIKLWQKTKIDSESKHFARKILEKKKQMSDEKLRILCVVNTVKNSRLLYRNLNLDKALEDFEILLLNSTIIPPRRKEIVDKMNKEKKHLERDTVLVSTQSIEAGMDIDCHFGFREMSPLDSIEQVAGRINRECERDSTKSELFLFDLGTSGRVYRGDARLSVQGQKRQKDIMEIINHRKFEEFYSEVIDYLKSQEREYADVRVTLLDPMGRLEFEKLSQREYIEHKDVTLFFPIELNLNRFDVAGIHYLEKKLGENVGHSLRGLEVWKILKNVYNGESSRKAYLEVKKLQSLLNNFTISVIERPISGESLSSFIQNRVNCGAFDAIGGIIKVSEEFSDKTYDINTGLDLLAMKQNVDNII